MKCPICGKDVELKNRQVGTDENGEPVFNEYAICRDCKKQWNLDKQRAKKAAARQAVSPAAESDGKAEKAKSEAAAAEEKAAVKKPAVNREEPTKKASAEEASAAKSSAAKKAAAKDVSGKDGAAKRPAPRKKAAGSQSDKAAADESASETGTRKPAADKTKTAPRKKSAGGTRPVKSGEGASSASAKSRPARKRPESASVSEDGEENRLGNIPSEKVRTKREKAVRKGYNDMLSTDPRHKASAKKSSPDISDEKETEKSVSAKRRDAEKISRKTPEPEIDDFYDDDDYEETVSRFRPARIVMGVISLIGFGFFIYKGFIEGLQGVSSGSDSSGTTFIILALCFLVSAMLYFIMQRKNTVFAFLLPMLFYVGSAVAAFLMKENDTVLLASAAAAGVLAVISLILAIASRGGDSDYDDYDDPFEDESDD